MGVEINLMAKYPRAKRDPAARAAQKTAEDQAIARKFGREFFDGERKHGYGGYTYSPKRWEGCVKDIIEYYAPFENILDVGCAKGHMLMEFQRAIPNLDIYGVDVSEYAIKASPPAMRQYLEVCDARALPFNNKSFDLAISINTLHNLDYQGCVEALRELTRISSQQYITVDGYRTEEEKQRMLDWNLTALTILHADDWRRLFDESGYDGEFSFWLP